MQDSILFWNAVALEANRVSHSDPDKRQQNGPTLSSRAAAIVHLAMYDAYAGIVGAGFQRYLNPPPVPPPDLSARDAVAGAAHRTLTRLYSAQVDFSMRSWVVSTPQARASSSGKPSARRCSTCEPTTWTRATAATSPRPSAAGTAATRTTPVRVSTQPFMGRKTELLPSQRGTP